MNFAKTSARCLWVLLALCLVATMMLGCTVQLPGDEEGKVPEDTMPPRIENNVIAQLSCETMWYRPDMLGESVVELTDNTVCQKVLAIFNNVEFRGLKEDGSETVESVYLEMKESQYLLLENCATVFVTDGGRVMLTIINGGQFITDIGAVDAEALRQICAPLLEDAAPAQ